MHLLLVYLSHKNRIRLCGKWKLCKPREEVFHLSSLLACWLNPWYLPAILVQLTSFLAIRMCGKMLPYQTKQKQCLLERRINSVIMYCPRVQFGDGKDTFPVLVVTPLRTCVGILHVQVPHRIHITSQPLTIFNLYIYNTRPSQIFILQLNR